jgi:uncharacterized membrane protein YqaE (UPF0057 family)
MLYLLAIFLPPVAVLMAGKPVQALINLLLTFCLWFPGMIHALLVVSSHQADGRTGRMMKQAERQHQQTLQLMQQQAEIEAARLGVGAAPAYVAPQTVKLPARDTGPSTRMVLLCVGAGLLFLFVVLPVLIAL